ncbi:cleavage stimulation factor subunit 2 [Trichonephila clavata]|uniref:Cleavage stimulation factor subunit 2 n=1 Tax=Trichonephila clavata TaxID=2740835 RepID=A0A8X6FQI3_TRICU|nr:cleavage stimulation factor subunit 2 [Trichonephila clavata]
MSVVAENDSALDRSLRSILVGNIPIEISEDILKDLLSEYGPVLNLKLFKDGTSRYVFCEYGESEMALRAVHNLTNFDLKGRALKVDIAASEKSKELLASLQESEGSAENEAADSSEKVPEEISKAVASLPAEQMFELMKQMKLCIENNPQEARNLLLQNPQLAYALLQAQVIMRIVDPEVAIKILNRTVAPPPTTEPEMKNAESIQQVVPTPSNPLELSTVGDQDMRQLPPMDSDMRTMLIAPSGDKDMRQMPTDIDWRTIGAPGGLPDKRSFDPRYRSSDSRIAPGADSRPGYSRDQVPGDSRGIQPSVDPRVMQGGDPRVMQDPRVMPGADPRMMQGGDPRIIQTVDPRAIQGTDPRLLPVDPRMSTTDSRGMSVPDPRGMQGADPRALMDQRPLPIPDLRSVSGVDSRGIHGMDPRALLGSDSRTDSGNRQQGPGPNFGPRNADPRNVSVTSRIEDPRKFAAPVVPVSARMPANTRTPVVNSAPPAGASPNTVPAPRQPVPTSTGAPTKVPEDQEKAALIMQVLQLSEEQIAMLPPEQRQSIIVLKEQIARSQLTM